MVEWEEKEGEIKRESVRERERAKHKAGNIIVIDLRQ